MTESRTTIADVARLAGVSKATVSYVLNNRTSGFRISAETSRKVLDICRKHDYQPDKAAVQLSKCRKAQLQLMVASPWLYSQFSDFMCQLNLVLHQHEHSSRLRISYVLFTPGELKDVLKTSVLKRFDAVLVVGTDAKDSEWLEKNSDHLSGKVVLMNRQAQGILSCCGNDSKSLAGLSRIVDFSHYDRFLVMDLPRHSFCETLRCKGFISVCESLKLKAESFKMADYSSVWTLLRPEIEKAGKVLVFCPQYIPAALLLKGAIASGISVPDKLGVIAYDRHSLLDQFFTPQLTSIDPRLDQMAGKTLELIFGLREKKKNASQIVKAEIIAGGTTVNKNKRKETI